MPSLSGSFALPSGNIVNMQTYAQARQMPPGPGGVRLPSGDIGFRGYSPSDAALASLNRSLTPWGPLMEPPVPYAGGAIGTMGRMAPMVGPFIGAGEAAYEASKTYGQPQPLPPVFRSGARDWVQAIGNLVGLLTRGGIGGEALKMAGMGLSGLRGLMGAPEFLNQTFGEMGASGAGALTRRLFGGGTSGPPSALPQTPSTPVTPGGSGVYSEPYTPGQYAWALDPTLNPGGFPTMGGVPSTIEQSNNPFYNPDTGITPTWAR